MKRSSETTSLPDYILLYLQKWGKKFTSLEIKKRMNFQELNVFKNQAKMGNKGNPFLILNYYWQQISSFLQSHPHLFDTLKCTWRSTGVLLKPLKISSYISIWEYKVALYACIRILKTEELIKQCTCQSSSERSWFHEWHPGFGICWLELEGTSRMIQF